MVNGGMKLLNYKEMSLDELRKYVINNREDEEAWNEFASRPRPNAIIIPADTCVTEQERILKEATNRK